MLSLEKEGGQEAKDISLHDIEHQALLERGFGDGTSGLGDLEAQQEATASGLDGDGAGEGELAKLLEQIVAGVGDLGEQTFLFDDLEVLEAEAAGERASAEGAAVLGHAEGVEELLVDDESAEGDAAAEGLAEDQGVGLNSGAGVGEPVSGTAEATLNLVEDEESVVLVGEAACLDEEGIVDDVDSAFAEDGLDENGGSGVGDRGTKLLEVVAVDEGDVGKAGAEVEAVLVLSGDGERAVGAAVVGVTQCDDAVLGVGEVLAGVGAGEFERALHGLGATGGVEDSLEPGESAEALGELAGIAAGVERGEMDELAGLVGHGCDHARVGVAEGVDAQTCHEVEIAVAGGVVEIDSGAMVHDNGVAGVDGKKCFRVAGKNTEGVGILPKIKHDLTITQECGAGVKF